MKGKIFNAQEVLAIMRADKTQFREAIKPQPNSEINPVYLKECNSWQWATKESRRECPYQVGQKIFVKESFADFRNNNSEIFYKSDFEINNLIRAADIKWKQAQHMKQEHSRIILLIKEIRVERLQDISEEDCDKEGIGHTGGWNGEDYDDGEFFFGKLIETEDGMNWKNEMFEYPHLAFEKYWDSTHKKPEEKFEASPWVWVINFEVI
jgi:hypothetical protein